MPESNIETTKFVPSAISSVKSTIISLLQECEPCNLEEICEAVRVHNIRDRRKILPAVISAIAELQNEKKIEEWEQTSIDDALEYCWVEVQGEN